MSKFDDLAQQIPGSPVVCQQPRSLCRDVDHYLQPGITKCRGEGTFTPEHVQDWCFGENRTRNVITVFLETAAPAELAVPPIGVVDNSRTRGICRTPYWGSG